MMTASAPGRMDVMGGIADYSGSLVLQLAIPEKATVTAAFRPDDQLVMHSADVKQVFSMAVADLPTDYAAARRALAAMPDGDWAAYLVGCLLVLHREKGIPLRGLELSLRSEVPIGKGLSSSAAVEVATMRALGQLYNVSFEGTELPVLAQMAENHVVGAPCGLMDQLASCFGAPDRLLPILCQPDRLFPAIDLPEGVFFEGIDSGVRHAVSGASYGEVRCAAFMGYSIIAQAEGVSIADLAEVRASGSRAALPYQGYLCNIPPSDFYGKYYSLLPESITGKDFVARFGGTIDSVTDIAPEAVYHVRDCALHPVMEHFRVQTFAGLLRQPLHDAALKLLGELMYQAHESYSRCGLGNAKTNELVALAKVAGPENGIYGAKITGGGSGGTVCFLGAGMRGQESLERIRRSFAGTDDRSTPPGQML